jgi:hypothetical protein
MAARRLASPEVASQEIVDMVTGEWPELSLMQIAGRVTRGDQGADKAIETCIVDADGFLLIDTIITGTYCVFMDAQGKKLVARETTWSAADVVASYLNNIGETFND